MPQTTPNVDDKKVKHFYFGMDHIHVVEILWSRGGPLYEKSYSESLVAVA